MGYLPIATALVGRVSELSYLTSSLDWARAGHGNIVFISGLPGIGKSRLALEASRLAARFDMCVLWGRCVEGETGRMFAPWVEALGDYLRELEWNRYQSTLGQTAATIAHIVPNLRDILPGLPAVASTTPAEDRQRLFDAVVHLILTAAHERAVLLILDDLQWADRASLALLRQLARDIGHAAVVILGTLREDEVAADHPLRELMTMLSREVPCQRITLTDLSHTEATELAGFVLEQHSADQTTANVDAALAKVLLDHTGGNPFFIQEIVRDLVDTGRFVRQQDHWVAASPAATWDVPREVRDVVDQRVRHLPISAQRMLRAACACTAGFTLAEAQGLTGMEEELLLDSLDAALHSQLLHVVDPPTVPARYDFGHALIRNALYAPLNPDRRARLHLQTARVLELGPMLDEQVGALATHYRLAGRFAAPERSIDYAIRAGDVAHARFAHEDAVTHWQSALDLMALHGVGPERRAALLEKMGDHLFIFNPGDEAAVGYLEQALALYEQIGMRDAVARLH